MGRPAHELRWTSCCLGSAGAAAATTIRYRVGAIICAVMRAPAERIPLTAKIISYVTPVTVGTQLLSYLTLIKFDDWGRPCRSPS